MSNNNGNGGTTPVEQLLQSAQDEGLLSAASMAALASCDLGAQIQAALGVRVDDVQASEVVLVTMMADDSGSIAYASNAQVVRDGHNLVLEALGRSRQKDNVLCHTRYLNGKILYPFCALARTVRMDAQNYDPVEGTPLYDQTVALLGTVLAKSQEFAESGVPVRTVTLLITDGADAHSVRATARDVAALVRDLRQAETHVVAAMGISDGTTDFRKVFREMGIEDRWILTPGNSPTEIRRAFQVFSQSAVQLSQGGGGGGGAAATGLGGFGA